MQETRGAARAGDKAGEEEEEEAAGAAGAGGLTKSGSESDHEEPAAGVTRKTTADAFPLPLALPLPFSNAASSHTGSQFFAAASRATLPLTTVRLRPPSPRTESPEQETENAESGVPAASPGANQRASTEEFFSFFVFRFFSCELPAFLSSSHLSLSTFLYSNTSFFLPLSLEIAAADRGAAPGRGCGNSAEEEDEVTAATAAAAAVVEEEASAARGSFPPLPAPLLLSLHASYDGGSATPLMIDSETRRRAAAGSAVWMRAWREKGGVFVLFFSQFFPSFRRKKKSKAFAFPRVSCLPLSFP